jgi:transposase
VESTVPDPAEEIATLRRMVAERDAIIAERDTALAGAAIEIEHLRIQVATLRRGQFGRSSERLAAEADQLELRLEELEETEAEQIAAVKGKTVHEHRGRLPAVRKPLPDHLPREIVVQEPEIDCDCGACRRLSKIGEDVTEVMERIPARLKVIRYVRPKYACRSCERIFQASAPDLPITKGRPGPGLLASIAVAKYCDGLPIYRQAGILAREGIDIDRQTMTDWMGHLAWWLKPLSLLIGTHVMARPVLSTDDTPIKRLAPGLGRTITARFWVYAVDPRSYDGQGPPAAFYRYSPDRKGERPRDHLAGFSGFLHADAFPGYDALYRAGPGRGQRILHVACWAHCRRKLFDVFEATKSPIAEEGLRRIQALYLIEAKINGKTADARLAERQARSVTLLADLKSWYERHRRRLSAKSKLGKALQYALSRWDALTRYTSDGRLNIDNNLSERLLRGIAVTRKNFLFLGSDRGGERAAIFYTMIETAKLNGLNPQAYLADIIHRLATGHPNTRLADLLPWNYAAAMSPETRAA